MIAHDMHLDREGMNDQVAKMMMETCWKRCCEMLKPQAVTRCLSRGGFENPFQKDVAFPTWTCVFEHLEIL